MLILWFKLTTIVYLNYITLYLCLCFQHSICQIFPLVEVVLLSVTLGLNNSPDVNDLPDNAAASCNESDRLYLYSSGFLTRSINIFCGLWLGFSCLAVIYQIIIFLITFMKGADINYQRLLKFVSSCGIHAYYMYR